MKTRRDGGFTLAEMLVVTAIIALLLMAIVFAVRGPREKALTEKTRSLLGKIDIAMASYYAEFGSYPPDGYDRPVHVQMGGRNVLIKGSTCLAYFLGRPISHFYKIGTAGEVRRKRVGPFVEWKTGELRRDPSDTRTVDELLNDPEAEVMDAWGHPICFDNVDERVGSQAQDLTNIRFAHTRRDFVEGLDHWKDPRAVGHPVQAKNRGSYDMWSHGHRVSHEDAESSTEQEILNDNVKNWGD